MDTQDRILLGSVAGFILAIAVLGAFSNPTLAPSEEQTIRAPPPLQEAAPIAQPKDVKSVAAPAPAPAPEAPRPAPIVAPVPAPAPQPAPVPAPPALPEPAVVSKEVVKEVPKEVIKEVIKEVPKEIVRQPEAQQFFPKMGPEPVIVPTYAIRGQGITDAIIPFGVAGLVGISISIFVKRKVEGTHKETS